ncbi:MAG: GIY-YIG nuclease family protein [Bacilli bacterium]|nr:GIY-YIG nuclease family protein [Bacilli bacterium]
MNGKLKLNDLLGLNEEELKNTKIRLNTYNGETNPIEEYKKNPQTLLLWNYWNNKKYKEGQISIGLVKMSNNCWLLFTVGIITKVLDKLIYSEENKTGGVQVEYKTLEQYSDLYGRVIIYYENNSQQMFRNAEGFIDKLEVKEILPSVYTGFDFPGYDNVCLSYSQLETVILGNYPSYCNALANQKAVYVITDKNSGKLYIGSATSDQGMLLSRWTSYIQNGHGGNVKLKELVSKLGIEYVKQNFQYTIIENFNSKVDDKYVLQRESYWKTVFQTRKYGYNDN